MSRIVDSVLDLVGNTPMIRLNRLVPQGAAEILVKLESFNPAGSVKDRVSLSMIEAAERDGTLQPGDTIVEPTSGNTGIGLAFVAAVKGYRLIIAMPDDASPERRALLEHYGARVVLTPARKLMQGAIDKAREIVAKNPRCFMPQQFNNPANPAAHRANTAVEILAATDRKIDVFVAGVGTGGTITGVGEVLKRELPEVRVIAVEPSKSAALSGGKVTPHSIQGIGAGFIPPVLNLEVIDEILSCDDEVAYRMAGELARAEGISAGISGGAAVWGALKIAADLHSEQRVVTVIPDAWERYISIDPPATSLSGVDFII
ncbi:MAG: cysteine synthase A [Proteobacteria bacterium]|nr:cysteine synthase A [Pseudomonadota bacterium]